VSVVELNCETDFVARGEDFKSTARDIAMHVAAMKPRFLNVEDVPAAVLDKEKEILMEQLNEAQRAKADKILPGKLEKFYEENVLVRQLFIKDESGKKTVKEVIDELSMKVGEKVQIRRFERMEVGEGIVRQTTNYVDEVMSMTSAQ
jgi:elongation factor Ts